MSYPNDPYGQQPYGQQPYGQQPYGTPQYGAYGPPPGPEPDNNLVWAILCTVLCCLPLGIVAIIKSTSVSKLWASGDYAGAQKAADEAKKWAMWGAISSVIIYVIVIIVYVVFFVFLFGVAATAPNYTYTTSYTYPS